MSDEALRKGLIRLAHAHPEFRKDLLPLISKEAGCEKLPEGGMRDNCEKKKEEGGKSDDKDKKEASAKVAGSAIVRRMVSTRIRVMRVAPGREAGTFDMIGMIGLSVGGGAEDAMPFRFEAVAQEQGDGTFVVSSFRPIRNVVGPGLDSLTGFYQSILAEGLKTQATQLLGAAQAKALAPQPVMG